jgi:Zn-dependent protease with chaperone function
MTINAEYIKRRVLRMIMGLLLVLCLPLSVFGQRTQIKRGWNLFSAQQDIELGQQVAQDAEKQLPMLNNTRVDDYLNRLGKRLASYAPYEKFPYQFKCVNDSTINAFALPGGFLFINRGVIEAADNEAELAGVMGHEIAHVALRHGTHQATTSQLYQAPLAILSVFGGDSKAALLAQLGADFAVNSVLLKYSRDAERQADLIGTQILFDANYDPVYMAKLFEKLDTGDRGTDFLSSHPNPDNRIENINVEIMKLGTRSGRRVNDTQEFRQIKSLVKSLPPAPKTGTSQTEASSREGTTQREKTAGRRETRPADPSRRLRNFFSEYIRLRYPDNWKVFGHDMEFTLTPEGGIIRINNDSAVAYGAKIIVFTPPTDSRSGISLEEATAQLIQGFQRSNPSMRLARDGGRVRVDGKTALSRVYENESPVGGREYDWIITVMRPEGLTAFIFVAPEEDFSYYQRTFENIIGSVDFINR